MGVHHKRKLSQIKCNLIGIRCHTDLTQVKKTSRSLSSEKCFSKSKDHALTAKSDCLETYVQNKTKKKNTHTHKNENGEGERGKLPMSIYKFQD